MTITFAGSFDSARASDTPHPTGPLTTRLIPEDSGRSKPESSAVHEHSTRPGAATGARPVSSISRSGGPSPTKAGHAPRPGPRGDYLRGRPTGARPAFVGLGPPERAASPDPARPLASPARGGPHPQPRSTGSAPARRKTLTHSAPEPARPAPSPPRAALGRAAGVTVALLSSLDKLPSLVRLYRKRSVNRQTLCLAGGCPRWGTPDRHGSV